MKEFEPKNDTRIEMSVKQKKEVKHELVDNLVPHEGHTVWKINKETLEIEPAKYTNATYNLTGDIPIFRRFDCLISMKFMVYNLGFYYE